jgi:hypothetical protein
MRWENELYCEYNDVRAFQLEKFSELGIEKTYKKTIWLSLTDMKNL